MARGVGPGGAIVYRRPSRGRRSALAADHALGGALWLGRLIRLGGRQAAIRILAGFFDGENRLSDLHFVASLDLDLLDLTRHRRRHLDRRLVGLELEDGLILASVSPGLTRTRSTSPDSICSPSSGRLKSVATKSSLTAENAGRRGQVSKNNPLGVLGVLGGWYEVKR